MVKRAALAAGYDPARFSGHSLRAGLATTASAAGVDERTIMEQTGHKTTVMVRRYIRHRNVSTIRDFRRLGKPTSGRE